MKSVTKRILVGTSLAAGVALFFYADSLAPAGRVPWFAAAMLGCLGAWEGARMCREKDGRLTGALLVPGAVLAFLQSPGGEAYGWFGIHQPLYAYVAGAALVAVAAFGIAAVSRGKGRASRPSSAAWLALWILPALYGLVWVDHHWGVPGLLMLIVLSKIGDIFGYFVGRQIGVRHPFPGISPNKTVAGCVASLVAGVAAGALFAAFDYPVDWKGGILGGALLGLALNLAAQAGDLFESWVKRRAGVKDSSTIFGPSGGVLDVVDSLLFTVPLALLVLPAVL